MSVADLFAWRGSNFKHERPSRFDLAKEKAREAAHLERTVYRLVGIRDRHRCRVCQAVTNPYALTLLTRGHHHHLVYRSAGGATSTENVCLLCADCHNDEHAHRIRVEGNADVALTIWARDATTDEFYVLKQELAPGMLEQDELRPLWSCGHPLPRGPQDVRSLHASGWHCFESSGGYLVQCAACHATDVRRHRREREG